MDVHTYAVGDKVFRIYDPRFKATDLPFLEAATVERVTEKFLYLSNQRHYCFGGTRFEKVSAHLHFQPSPKDAWLTFAESEGRHRMHALDNAERAARNILFAQQKAVEA